MRHPEKVYSREQLLNRIWHNDLEVEYRTVDSYIRRLRRHLAPFRNVNITSKQFRIWLSIFLVIYRINNEKY